MLIGYQRVVIDMLKPAICYADEIQKKFQEHYYSDDMFLETGSLWNWTPEMKNDTEYGGHQYAIVDSKDNVIGYIAFSYDYYSSNARNFGLFSFNRGNILIGKAVYEVVDMLINKYKAHRIEWRMISGNPVERHYDKFCDRYNGNKYWLHDAVKDRQGNYHDDIIYEIIIER